MLTDLFDIAFSHISKLLSLLLLSGSVFGLYIWAAHEHRTLQKEEKQQKRKKRQYQRRKTRKIRACLKKRGFLSFSLSPVQKSLFSWKQKTAQLGLVLPNAKEGLQLLKRQENNFLYLEDVQGDGIDPHDRYGTIRFEKGEWTTPITYLLNELSSLQQKRVKKQYKRLFQAVQRACKEDRRHLQHIEALRKASSFSFWLTIKRPKWQFWKRKQYLIKILLDESLPPEKRPLLLIYESQKRGIDCKRNHLLPWKKSCKGQEERQHLFIDKAQVGLNPKDGDLHGTRIIRNGIVYKQSGLKKLLQFPFKKQIELRRFYKKLLSYAYRKHSSLLSTKKP